jgi:sigma-B regulation protein RsbU (phosphoserine phosphatase)
MCGDYYDFIRLGPRRLIVSLGDASGHGVGPALQMTEVRCTVRILARLGGDLPSVMGDLNCMLCEDLPESSYVSFFLADVDVENHTLQYLGAGHDAFLIRADGTVVWLESTHPLLGIDPSVCFSDVATTPIDRGDVLFLFTDGLNEAYNIAGEQYGRKQAVEIVAQHRREHSERVLQELFQSVFEFTTGRNLDDDITAVVLRVVE